MASGKKNCSTELLRQMSRGSTEAFAQFYDKYIHLVFQIALNVVKDPLEAEDICHDVFLEVYQHPNHFDASRGSIDAWLAVKTRSRSIDHLRKKKPYLIDNWQHDFDKRMAAPSAEMLAIKKTERAMIHQAMQQIPLEQRDVLYHTYFRNRTHQEVSEFMKRPIGTIKSRIRYGLRNLKKQLTLHHWVSPEHGGEQK